MLPHRCWAASVPSTTLRATSPNGAIPRLDSSVPVSVSSQGPSCDPSAHERFARAAAALCAADSELETREARGHSQNATLTRELSAARRACAPGSAARTRRKDPRPRREIVTSRRQAIGPRSSPYSRTLGTMRPIDIALPCSGHEIGNIRDPPSRLSLPSRPSLRHGTIASIEIENASLPCAERHLELVQL